MIMPLDIQNKEFSKGVRGYKEEEVDQFLDMLTRDYEKVLEDNRSLKLKVSELESELEKKKQSEDAVMETLATTKSLMQDISQSAEKRAKILLKNAELDAEVIVREARESVDRYKEEYQELKNRFNIFNTRYKTLLEAELEKFDVLGQELFYKDELKLEKEPSSSAEEGEKTINIEDIDQLL